MASSKLIVTVEERDFDPVTVQYLRDEGFQVTYLPCSTPRKAYEKSLHGLADPLEEGEKYAIVGLCSILYQWLRNRPSSHVPLSIRQSRLYSPRSRAVIHA